MQASLATREQIDSWVWDLRGLEKLRSWHVAPAHYGTEEIPPPPPKKPCMDKVRNAIAGTAAQIWTGHWRSAVFLGRIKESRGDRCWFCRPGPRMIRPHVLLHYTTRSPVRGMGRKGPGGDPRATKQPQIGEKATTLLGPIKGREGCGGQHGCGRGTRGG